MTTEVDDLVAGIRAGDRRALARAITLVESTRADHRRDALHILDTLTAVTGQSTRVGISGAPGVGKSTFIEVLGLQLVDRGHRVAVLAVDPSSARSGGSVLGDKTRMVDLARHDATFIRPSPSGGTLGGVARRTRDALLLCEAAGFDIVVVETVGVGQSETAVADMVDTFVLLVQPGAGDELQGIKRGIVELADVVVVTKADGELAAPARRAAADYRQALQFLRRRDEQWEPPVVVASSVTGDGVPETWGAVESHHRHLRAVDALARRRAEQARAWLWSEVRDRLLDRFRGAPAVATLAPVVERAVADSTMSAPVGAQKLLDAFEGG